MVAILRLLAAFIANLFKSRRRLEGEILFLRHQLNIALRRRPARLRLRGSDRALLVWMTRLWPSLLGMARVVEPATILRWYRAGFRSYWRWKSRKRAGRPRIDRDLRDLIRLLLLAQFLRNQRGRMDLAANAEELKKALQGLQQRAGKAEIVSVPADLLEHAARIETAQIVKERKDAVLQSVLVGPSGYGITFDRAAAEQRQMLDVTDRVELEDLVAELSIEGPGKLTSQSGSVAAAEGATRRREKTKSKRVEIEYVIDQASRGIRIFAVRQGGHSGSSAKGDTHA